MAKWLPIALALLLSGCVQAPTAPVGDGRIPDGLLSVTLMENAAPVALALVEARDAQGATLWLSSTDLHGRLNVTVGSDVARLLVWRSDGAHGLSASGVLSPAADAGAPPFTLSPRVAFPNPTFPVQAGTTCADKTDGDVGCGLDEPSVVVDGRGWVYYTAACCFFVSSPVFVSRDEGQTFQELEHPLKDAYGNEGDLAVDDAGNLYYMDIDLATFGFARWNPDLSPAYGYRRPGEPLVDRPWIRAGPGGIVHAVYNTGLDTIHYRSTDYGLTFSAAPTARFGSGLARAYSDVGRNWVGFVGSGDFKESRDGGAAWGEREEVRGCTADVAAVDEAGTTWFQGEGCVVGRTLDGTWTAPRNVVPPGIETFFTWSAAGGEGGVAVAYYGRVEDAALAGPLGLEPDAWYLFVSFSSDAAAPDAHWSTILADPEMVGQGGLGRALGDFMMVAVGPDGGIHVAYARNPEMDDSATAVYVRTSPLAGLAPTQPLVGPHEHVSP